MRKITHIIFTLMLFASAAFAQAADDKKAAIAVVNQLFTEMAAANPAGIVALHTPTSDLAAVFKQRDGKSRYQSINGEAFSKMFTDKTKVMREEMYAPNVEVTAIGRWSGDATFSLTGISSRTAASISST